MKTLLVVLSLAASCLPGRSQTFVNYMLTNFATSGPGVVGCSTNVSLASNTIVKVINFQYQGVNTANLTVQYPGGPVMSFPVSSAFNVPVLGPATIQLQMSAPTGSSPAAYVLVEYDAVNTALPAQASMVLPAGHGATMTLQTSTNLSTWTTATNGTYSSANVNRFFRMNLVLQ